jgi:glycosyltransferase involved in cell wall biosynthesis
MRIAHLINNLRGGGAQNLVVELAIAQRALGHTVSLILVDRAAVDYERQLIQRLRDHQVAVVELDRPVGRRSPGAWIATSRRLVARLVALGPDVLNSHLEMSHLLAAVAWRWSTHARAAHTRRLATVHNAPETWGRRPVPAWLARAVFWRLLNRTTPRVYCSPAARACEPGWNGSWTTIPNGISPVVAPPQAAAGAAAFRQEFGIPADALVVVSVASIRPEKNQAAAVRAVARCRSQLGRPVHLVLCGAPGSGSEAVAAAIAETGSAAGVHLAGLRPDVRAILFYADCYLSASVREGLPLAVLEALFAGLPCVLSAIKPHRDLVGPIPGCHLAAPEPAPLVEALQQALSERADRRTLVARRAPHLAAYTIATCAARYLRFYEALLADHAVGQPVGQAIAWGEARS